MSATLRLLVGLANVRRTPVTAQKRAGGGVVLSRGPCSIALSDSEFQRLAEFVLGAAASKRFPA